MQTNEHEMDEKAGGGGGVYVTKHKQKSEIRERTTTRVYVLYTF
jgi:hypothetical protein